MGADEARWYYVGDGQLRLKQGEVWTDQYEKIKGTRAHAAQDAVVAEPGSIPPLPGSRRRGRPMLWLMVCAGLVVAGGTGTAFATGGLNPERLLSAVSTAGSAAVAASVGAPAKAAPNMAAPAMPTKRGPAAASGGYKRADYAKGVGAIPVRVADVREDSEYTLATRVDLMSLGLQFDSIGRLPAPPKVDPKWWTANTRTLSQLSLKAADEWAGGHHKAAMRDFEAVVKRSNTLVTKVNAACGLQIRLSKTSA